MKERSSDLVEIKKIPVPLMAYLCVGECIMGRTEDDCKGSVVTFGQVREVLKELTQFGVKFVTLIVDRDFFLREGSFDLIKEDKLKMYLLMDLVLKEVKGNELSGGFDIYQHPVRFREHSRRIFGHYQCTAGQSSFFISPCGAVAPCSGLFAKCDTLPNFKEGISGIWRSMIGREVFSDEQISYCLKRCLFHI